MAALLLEPNRVVSVDRLIAAAWNDDPPVGARVQVQNRVGALRKALRKTVPGEDLIATAGSGYVIRVRDGQLDVDRFGTGLRRADAFAGTGNVTGALGELDDALALWRGPALDGQDSQPLRAAAQRFEEQRLHAIERRLQLRAALGQYPQLPAELADLIQEHPYREGLRALLMLVLYRCGRAAEALETYLDARTVFAEQLGITPGDVLQRLHLAILRDDEDDLREIAAKLGIASPVTPTANQPAEPAPAPAPLPEPQSTTVAPAPRELPLDPPSFTGRDAEIEKLAGQLESGGVVAIHGPGGVGKSALAVHLAHRLAERFSDGQLYVNLHGATPDVEPLEPAEVLAQFLRALGAGTTGPAEAPGLDELAARYRSVTAGKKLLVLLDDAADSAQVRPLIPGSASCAVVVTSRPLLTCVDGIGRHRLAPFAAGEAVDLLARLAGAERIGGASPAIEELVQLCDRLPLALSIVAGRLNARPAWTVEMLVSRLSDQRRRLDELTHGDRAVRASFLMSYLDLIRHPVGVEAGRMFRLVGQLDVPDVGPALAAAVSGCSAGEAEKLLDLLVDAELLENELPGRYRLHDLLRLYARERAATEDRAADRIAAIQRGFGHYLATARSASLCVQPVHRLFVDVEPQRLEQPGVPLRTHADAVEWIESERDNLLAVVRQAAATPEIGPEAVIALVSALHGPLGHAGLGRGQLALQEILRAASARTSSPHHLAVAAFVRGGVLHALQPEEAAAQLRQARDWWRELGYQPGEALALTHLGTTYGRLDRLEESLACLQVSLALFRNAGNDVAEACCLDHLGLAYRRLGRKDDAIAAYRLALLLSRRTGYRAGEVITAANLATALHTFGELDAAMPAYEHALDLVRTAGNRLVEAECLWGLADLLIQLGRIAAGQDRRRQSADILFDLGWLTVAERHAMTVRLDPPVPAGFWTNI